SPAPRFNLSYPRYERGHILDRPFQVHPPRRRHLLLATHARPPLPRRADRAGCEPAAAIRANIMQMRLDAIGAERALVAANPRVPRVGRQVLVAIFAIRPQLQHHRPSSRAAAASNAP